MDQDIKSPRGEAFIKLGDLVYQFSPRAVINLSRKLTLQWIGPFCIVEILSPSLSVIFPVGNWAAHKKEVKKDQHSLLPTTGRDNRSGSTNQ